jgi:uncharacterized protein (TIGR03118 family)
MMLKRAGLVGVGVLACAALVVGAPLTADAHGRTTAFTRTDLVSDQPGRAPLTDAHLVNAWGMSRGPNTPIWVSNAGTGTSTLYNGAVGGAPVAATPLVVSIPGGPPTGQVFNDTTAFTVPGTATAARFMFAGVAGDISAWSAGTTAVGAAHVDGASYTGLALAHSPFGPLLIAADFHDARLDVFNGQFTKLPVDQLFRDGKLPRGYAPFNVTEIGDQVFVTYAKQDAAKQFDVPGRGHGFVDVFTNYGAFVRRLYSGGVLNSPWGLTLAPASFGTFANDLLVGNFGDGLIHAFDPHSGRLVGTLSTAKGRPIVIDGLWGLLVGDAAAGGPDAVWFSAGPGAAHDHGLLGILTAAN